MTDVNFELLQEIRDDIAANDHLFSMSTYGTEHECGTVCCIAGFAAKRDGYKLVATTGEDGDTEYGWRKNDDDPLESADHIGKRVLGLSGVQADHMFLGGWHHNGIWATNEKALAYLDKAIAEKDVMVRVYGL